MCLPGNCDDNIGGPIQVDYTCYQVTCKYPVTRAVEIIDQFGQRHVAIRPAPLLCAPARRLPAP